MKAKFYFFLTLLVFFTSSCAFHSGMMTGNASLGGNEFELVRIAQASAKTMRVFFIGGFGADGLVLAAKANLYRDYPLEQGQAYANVSVDFGDAFFPFVHTTTCIITADIVQTKAEARPGIQKLFEVSAAPFDSAYAEKIAALPYKAGDVMAVFNGNDLIPVRVVTLNPNRAKPYTVQMTAVISQKRLHLKEDNLLWEEPLRLAMEHAFKVGDQVMLKNGAGHYGSGVVAAINSEWVVYKSGTVYDKVRPKNLKARE